MFMALQAHCYGAGSVNWCMAIDAISWVQRGASRRRRESLVRPTMDNDALQGSGARACRPRELGSENENDGDAHTMRSTLMCAPLQIQAVCGVMSGCG
jgi:hypothetical protein